MQSSNSSNLRKDSYTSLDDETLPNSMMEESTENPRKLHLLGNNPHDRKSLFGLRSSPHSFDLPKINTLAAVSNDARSSSIQDSMVGSARTSAPIVITLPPGTYISSIPVSLLPYASAGTKYQESSCISSNQKNFFTPRPYPFLPRLEEGTSKSSRRKPRRKTVTQEELGRRKTRRREVCKINQRRYRERNRVRRENLGDIIIELKENIKTLSQVKSDCEHQLVNYRAKQNLTNIREKVVNTFIDLFKNGFYLNSMDNENQKKQIDFLSRELSKDIRCGEISDLKTFILKLQKVFPYHPEQQVVVKDISAMPRNSLDPVIRVTFELNVLITRDRIALFCPSLLDNEIFVNNVLGKQLEIPGHLIFYFDDRLMTRLNIELDYAASWTQFVSNIVEISTIMSETVRVLCQS